MKHVRHSVAALCLALTPAVSAQTQDSVDISMAVSIVAEPVSGLEDIEIDISLGDDTATDPGSGGGGGAPPVAVDPDNPPVIETEFCLYVPDGGLEITISGQNDSVDQFFVTSDQSTNVRISYIVALGTTDPGLNDIGSFTPGQPLVVDQPGFGDDRNCTNGGDNATLDIDFSGTAPQNFKVVVEGELTPGQTYTFTDVLTLNVSQPFGG